MTSQELFALCAEIGLDPAPRRLEVLGMPATLQWDGCSSIPYYLLRILGHNEIICDPGCRDFTIFFTNTRHLDYAIGKSANDLSIVPYR